MLYHESDLSRVLDQQKSKEPIVKGEKRCKFCEDVITMDNLYSLLPQSGMINLICDKPECVGGLMSYLTEKGKTEIG